MVTTTIDPHSGRARWLRRSTAAAVATMVLGVTGTGLAVGILSARQPDTAGGGAEASSGPGNSGTGDNGTGNQGSTGGSTSDNGGSGLGSAQQGAPAQGGSHGS
ncbi:hypothetical protein [Kribbella sp. CA-294648]|uniref:hypothetical protein n=1 Tax=Kribbella sp. CA-294648 TaxID=3239948 RepID=UPI003D912970